MFLTLNHIYPNNLYVINLLYGEIFIWMYEDLHLENFFERDHDTYFNFRDVNLMINQIFVIIFHWKRAVLPEQYTKSSQLYCHLLGNNGGPYEIVNP